MEMSQGNRGEEHHAVTSSAQLAAHHLQPPDVAFAGLVKAEEPFRGDLDEAITKITTEGNTVYSLDLQGHGIGDEGLRRLAEALQHPHAKVKVLVLSANQITDIGIEALARILPQTAVQVLDLTDNRITPDGAQHLAACLPRTTLKVLNLAYNQIATAGAKHLAVVLPPSQNLQVLDLGHNQINDAGLQHIAKVLPQSPSLQVLALAFNRISDKGVQYLTEVLSGTRLLALYLQRNQISDTGVQHLVKVLSETLLQTLYLGHNPIGITGAKHLAKVLSSTVLQTLDLANCDIRTAGAEYLAEALPDATALQVMDLSNNQIMNEGAKPLTQALSESSLESFYLGGNELTDEGAKCFAAVLPQARSLRALHLGSNYITQVGARCLTEASVNSSLLGLYLGGNDIADGKHVVSGLPKRALQALYMGNNKIGAGAVRTAEQALNKVLMINAHVLDANFQNGRSPQHFYFSFRQSTLREAYIQTMITRALSQQITLTELTTAIEHTENPVDYLMVCIERVRTHHVTDADISPYLCIIRHLLQQGLPVTDAVRTAADGFDHPALQQLITPSMMKGAKELPTDGDTSHFSMMTSAQQCLLSPGDTPAALARGALTVATHINCMDTASQEKSPMPAMSTMDGKVKEALF